MASILVVDDDDIARAVIVKTLRRKEYEVHEAQSGDRAIKLLDKNLYDVVICDMVMEGLDGLQVLSHSKRTNPDVEFIIMTAFGTIPEAVKAMRMGAYDYLTKPHSPEELEITVSNAIEKNKMRTRIRQLERQMKEQLGFKNIITVNPTMQQLIKTALSVARTDSNVLITGESGTGKELIAGVIHNHSPYEKGPFIAVNCGGLPEPLLESELFGHVKGAFTNAITTKRGLVEEADGGTLFLDEVGEMNPPLQVKLLRFIQNGEVRRVGENVTRKVKVRIIAATNKDLKKAMEEGEFREDLFYRLSVIPLHIPPIRERKEDISVLANHFLKMFSEKLNKNVKSISQEAMQLMMQYKWPGNVRELMNAIEHGVALSPGEMLRVDDLPPSLTHRYNDPLAFVEEAPGTLADVEKGYILKVLQQTGWNQKKACQILGLSKATLYRRLKKYGIRPRLMMAALPK